MSQTQEDDQAANPFFNKTANLTTMEVVKMVLMAPIALVRILLLVVSLLFLALICMLATCGMDFSMDPETKDRRPMGGCRRALLLPVRLIARVMLFLFGYVWIEEGFRNGRCCGTAAKVIVANHVTWIEPLYFIWRELPCAAAKSELADSYIGAVVSKSLSLVLVDRFTSEGRHNALQQIANRASPTSGFPPLIIFPEGTTSSQSTLTTFKRGAFAPLQPVQPVVVQYPFCNFDPAWVPGISTTWHALRMVCQVYNRLQVDYLPVLSPTVEETADSRPGEMFAARVRDVMAGTTDPNMVVTTHAFEDVRLLSKVAKPGYSLKTISSVTTTQELDDMLEWNLDDVQWALDKFREFDKNRDGLLDVHEFCQGFKLDSDSEFAHGLFASLDKDGMELLDFKEAALAVALLSPKVDQDAITRLSFLIFSLDGDMLTSADFGHMLDFYSRLDPSLAENTPSLVSSFSLVGTQVNAEDFSQLIQTDAFVSLRTFLDINNIGNLANLVRSESFRKKEAKRPRADC